jgi:hypothetical protein
MRGLGSYDEELQAFEFEAPPDKGNEYVGHGDVCYLYSCFYFRTLVSRAFVGVHRMTECIQTRGGSDRSRSTKYSVRAVIVLEWYLNDSPTCIPFPLSCLPLTVLIIP